MQLFLFLCNTRSSNSTAMGCSHRKLSKTGLRIVGAFLKVKLYYNICGTQGLLRFAGGRGLSCTLLEYTLHTTHNQVHIYIYTSAPADKKATTKSEATV